MENKNDKRVLRVELNDDVKRVSITGKDSDENVVMRQELDEEELDIVTGGESPFSCSPFFLPPGYAHYFCKPVK